MGGACSRRACLHGEGTSSRKILGPDVGGAVDPWGGPLGCVFGPSAGHARHDCRPSCWFRARQTVVASLGWQQGFLAPWRSTLKEGRTDDDDDSVGGFQPTVRGRGTGRMETRSPLQGGRARPRGETRDLRRRAGGGGRKRASGRGATRHPRPGQEARRRRRPCGRGARRPVLGRSQRRSGAAAVLGDRASVDKSDFPPDGTVSDDKLMSRFSRMDTRVAFNVVLSGNDKLLRRFSRMDTRVAFNVAASRPSPPPPHGARTIPVM